MERTRGWGGVSTRCHEPRITSSDIVAHTSVGREGETLDELLDRATLDHRPIVLDLAREHDALLVLDRDRRRRLLHRSRRRCAIPHTHEHPRTNQSPFAVQPMLADQPRAQARVRADAERHSRERARTLAHKRRYIVLGRRRRDARLLLVILLLLAEHGGGDGSGGGATSPRRDQRRTTDSSSKRESERPETNKRAAQRLSERPINASAGLGVPLIPGVLPSWSRFRFPLPDIVASLPPATCACACACVCPRHTAGCLDR